MEEKKKLNKIYKRVFILIFILILIDQITKGIIYTDFQEFNVNTTENIKHIFISCIIIFIIFRYILNKNRFIKNSSRYILSFAVAGGIGNLIDRIIFHYIRNFIEIKNFTNINLSYIYIFIAWLGMAIILTIDTADIITEKKKRVKEIEKNVDERKNFK